MRDGQQQQGMTQALDQGPGPVAVAFGDKVRSVQRDQGLTLRALAERLGVSSHGHLSDIMGGKAMPSRALVARIDELGELGGALLRQYGNLLDEWDAKRQARAERRRQLAANEQARTRQRRQRAVGSAGNGPDTRTGRYPGDARPVVARDGEASGGREDDVKRREAVKAGFGVLLAAGAARSKALLRWAESPTVGPLTLEEFDESVTSLTERALALPMADLLQEADKKADEVGKRLTEGRHSGQQRAHLELLVAQFAYLQGRFASCLGNFGVAQTHLRLAKHYGRKLGHHLLLASAADVESTIAFYQGQYSKALRIAQEAQQSAPAHTAARLAVDEAKAYGGMGSGFRQEVREALDRAEGQLPDMLVFEAGAASPFGAEMYFYHAGTASVRAGDDRAAELARQAIREYEALAARGEQRASFANLASARLDLAIALVQGKRPEPREAARLAVQALAVPRERQQDQVRRRVRELLMLLSEKPSWRTMPAVKELADMARSYRPLALPAPPPSAALGRS